MPNFALCKAKSLNMVVCAHNSSRRKREIE